MRRVAIVVGILLVFTAVAVGGYTIGSTSAPVGAAGQAIIRPGTTPTPDEPGADLFPSPAPSPNPSPTPEPPVIDDATRGGPSGSVDDTGSDAVALTFDDGPHPKWTPIVLDELAAVGASATFCVVGKEARRHPDLVRRIVDEGHTLCNHSWNHEYDLGDRDRAAIEKNLKRTNAAIRSAVPDARVAYYRQPGGEWTKRVVSVAEDLGMVPLHWSVDPSDWNRDRKATQINKQVVREVGPGDIVLMHDGGGDRRRTANALGPILADLTSRFTLVGLP